MQNFIKLAMNVGIKQDYRIDVLEVPLGAYSDNAGSRLIYESDIGFTDSFSEWTTNE